MGGDAYCTNAQVHVRKEEAAICSRPLGEIASDQVMYCNDEGLIAAASAIAAVTTVAAVAALSLISGIARAGIASVVHWGIARRLWIIAVSNAVVALGPAVAAEVSGAL